MPKKLIFLILSVAFFFFFVFFSFLVHKNLFTHLDFSTTVRLQDHLPRRVDGIFSVLSVIGRFEFMLILLLIIIALTRKVWGIVLFVMFGVMHLFEIYGKFFVEHKPPPHFMLRTERIGNFPEFYISTENSYPSGHSGRAIFLSIAIGFLIWRSKLSRHWKILLLGILVGYDLTMFVSRIYLGEHWLSDVIGGALLGASLSLVSLSFSGFRLQKHRD